MYNSSLFPLPAVRLPLLRLEESGEEHRPHSRRKLLSNSWGLGKQATIHHMLGSFYSHIWVGTPPQRVSVIVDTGSHYTAFPCVGCKCGKHMDPYFDPTKSTSSVIPSCAHGTAKSTGTTLSSKSRCFLKQSYSEGSSWHAYKVRDKVWIGGENVYSSPSAFNLSTVFEFGCQDVETGLFRTQHVDGIMGMSGVADTYPHVLHANGITSSKVFAMCFRLGGGVLTIGGVDESIHTIPTNVKNAKTGQSPPSTSILFAKQVSRKSGGWFAVRLLDILMRDSKTKQIASIGVPFYKFNTGKGVIIDSGTTDTYLPAAAMSQFLSMFKHMSGIEYTNNKRDLTKDEFETLPTVIYRLEGADGNPIDIESPPSSYTETIMKTDHSTFPLFSSAASNSPDTRSKYAFRIYLTEPMGTVLGANFMLGHNVIFDFDGRRIGFAKSDCLPSTENFDTLSSDLSSISSTRDSFEAETDSESDLVSKMVNHFKVLSAEIETLSVGHSTKVCVGKPHLSMPCNAACRTIGADGKASRMANYISTGIQIWATPDCHLTSEQNKTEQKCSVLCAPELGISRPNPEHPLCFIGPWSPCQSNCTQHRHVARQVNENRDSSPSNTLRRIQPEQDLSCSSQIETRSCSTFLCPLDAQVVTFELTVRNVTAPNVFDARAPLTWSYVLGEDLIRGLSLALQLEESQFNIYSGPRQLRKSRRNDLALEIKLRLPISKYGQREANLLGKAIVEIASSYTFPSIVALVLNGNATER